jgi:hypothetical protein
MNLAVKTGGRGRHVVTNIENIEEICDDFQICDDLKHFCDDFTCGCDDFGPKATTQVAEQHEDVSFQAGAHRYAHEYYLPRNDTYSVVKERNSKAPGRYNSIVTVVL